MKTFAVIPTKYVNIDTLSDLLMTLSSEPTVDDIFIMENSDLITYESWPDNPKIKVMASYGLSIYQMWNFAWRTIRENYDGELNIAFLNDDIKIFPDYSSGEYLGIMSDFLRADADLGAVYPDYDKTKTESNLYSIKYTESTFGDGGMSGFCFMLKGELEIPYVDEAFQLYWGDDDLVKEIVRAGYKIGRVMGLPIEHAGSQTIKTLNPQKRLEMMERDRQYFNSKWGENRGPVW